MAQPLRFGILGTGNIAAQFTSGLETAHRSRIVAVASREPSRAGQFAAAHQIETVHPTYDALLADPNVDAVYNSLPNSSHHEWTIKALRAGKHVLCEKPLAVSLAEAREMFDEARRAKKLLVEAFMYRSHPLTHAVLEAVGGGAIGELRMIRSSFCYRTMRISGNIRFDPALAGGGLMDVGCYCIDFSRLLAGEPIAIHAQGHLHASGVDDMAVGAMKFPSGVLASFTCGMSVQADNTAYVCGTDGYIEIPIPWKPPMKRAEYTIARSTPPRMDLLPGTPQPPPRQTHYVDSPSSLYGLEADDFAAAVQDGRPPAVSEADTLGNMAVLDEMRRQLGPGFGR
jgi:predicted dehydrogenase